MKRLSFIALVCTTHVAFAHITCGDVKFTIKDSTLYGSNGTYGSCKKTLDLSRKELATLSAGVFSRLSSLKTLNLSINSLTHLPDGVFSGLSSLETLDLRDNMLSTLPGFSGLSSLVDLYVYNNPYNMTTRSDEIFAEITSLKNLYVTPPVSSSQPHAMPNLAFRIACLVSVILASKLN